MKIFETVEKNFSLMGISAYQSRQNHPFNAKNLLVLSILCTTLFSDVMYLIRETNDFKEYTISIFSACTMIVAISIFAIILTKMRQIFYYQHHIEEVINKSNNNFIKKLHTYSQLNFSFRTQLSNIEINLRQS